MKFVLTVVLGLVLLVMESVLTKYLGWIVTRVDVTVILVVFLALRASTLEGAFSAFVLGYLLDVMSGRTTGLYTFLAVLTFLLCRLGSSLVDVRSAPAYALFVAAAALGHDLLAAFFAWLVSKDGVSVGSSLSGLPLEILFTGLMALLLYPLLRRLDPGHERPEIGALR